MSSRDTGDLIDLFHGLHCGGKPTVRSDDAITHAGRNNLDNALSVKGVTLREVGALGDVGGAGRCGDSTLAGDTIVT